MNLILGSDNKRAHCSSLTARETAPSTKGYVWVGKEQGSGGGQRG